MGLKPKVHLFLFLVTVLAARAQVSICNGTYNLVTTMTQPDCFGGQGQVTLSIQNYTGVFKAKWLADNDEVLSKSLFAGSYNYKVWIPGEPGCSKIDESPTYQVIVTQPTPVVPNVSIEAFPSCAPSQAPNGPDGILKVTPSGGTSIFLYKIDWDPVVGSNAFLNGSSFVSGEYERLGAGPGTYYVAVRDDNGCLGQDSVTVPFGIPLPMAISAMVINPACSGQKGSLDLSIANGTNMPLRYSLLNPSDFLDTLVSNFVGDFTNIDEGYYLASVTDQKGCTVRDNISVNSPNPLVFSIDQVSNVQCFGESDGSIRIGLSGGNPPYTIYLNNQNLNQIQTVQWSSSGSNLQVTAFQRALASGSYSAYSIDASGCISDTVYFTIDQPVANNGSSALAITATSVSACFPGTQSGRIIATAAGGYPTYNFAFWTGNRTGSPRLWDRIGNAQGWPANASIINEYDNLSPGTYTVGVKDQYGCQRRTLVVVGTKPNILLSQLSTTNVDCNGNSNGSITVVSGAKEPRTFELLPIGVQQSTPTFVGLSAGPYQIRVSDSSGCQSNLLSIDITEPEVLAASIVNTRDPSCNPGLGNIWYNISGGTLNYHVILNGIISRTINTITSGYSQSISQGTYAFQVKDENGCESTLENFTISGPPSPGINGTGLTVSIQSFQHVTCPSGTDGSILLSIQGGWPALGGYSIEVETVTSYLDRLGYVRTSYSPFRITNNSLIDNLSSGRYRIRVKDGFGCSQIVEQSIAQPDPIVINFNGITGNCGGIGNNSTVNGGVTLNEISGGNGPNYTYILNGANYNTQSSPTPKFFPNVNLSQISMLIIDNEGCNYSYPY